MEKLTLLQCLKSFSHEFPPKIAALTGGDCPGRRPDCFRLNWGSQIHISSRLYEVPSLHSKSTHLPHPHDQTRLLTASYGYVPPKKNRNIFQRFFFRDEKIGPNRKIVDYLDMQILRYGDYTQLEPVLRSSDSAWSPIATSMSVVLLKIEPFPSWRIS